MELTLRAMGRAHVEAIHRPGRLDLVLRCETTFSPEARERIVAALGPVLEEFGLAGSCRFEPLDSAAAAAVRI